MDDDEFNYDNISITANADTRLGPAEVIIHNSKQASVVFFQPTINSIQYLTSTVQVQLATNIYGEQWWQSAGWPTLVRMGNWKGGSDAAKSKLMKVAEELAEKVLDTPTLLRADESLKRQAKERARRAVCTAEESLAEVRREFNQAEEILIDARRDMHQAEEAHKRSLEALNDHSNS